MKRMIPFLSSLMGGFGSMLSMAPETNFPDLRITSGGNSAAITRSKMSVGQDQRSAKKNRAVKRARKLGHA